MNNNNDDKSRVCSVIILRCRLLNRIYKKPVCVYVNEIVRQTGFLFYNNKSHC